VPFVQCICDPGERDATAGHHFANDGLQIGEPPGSARAAGGSPEFTATSGAGLRQVRQGTKAQKPQHLGRKLPTVATFKARDYLKKRLERYVLATVETNW
jgi:hypothetical protein